SNWAAEFEKWTGVGHTILSLSKPRGPVLPAPYDAASDPVQQQRVLHAVRVRARRVITQVVSFGAMASSKMQMAALKSWHAHGGVLIMGYHVFRRLVQRATTATVASSDKPADADGRLPDSARSMPWSGLATSTNGLAAPTSPNGTWQQQNLLRKYLIDEGPCLVIADEGHCIKNPETQLAKAANMLKTRARICLTGYPLQNRIEEYWTMVDFCYPQFLGDLADFRYRYIKPINDGMYVDATKDDKRRSKLHMGMLQKLLETMVDRRDSGLLYHELPRKVEYFISCPLTPMQSQLYIEYLARFAGIGLGAREGTNIGLLQHGHLLLTICNHPAVFKASVEENRRRRQQQQQQQRQRQRIQQQADLSAIIDDVADISAIDEEGKCDGDELTSRIADDDAWCREIYERHCGRSQSGIAIADDIADDIDNSGVQNPEHSTKVRMALHIIRESIACGERVLVFSRSIPTLDYLQRAIEHAGIAGCDGQKQKGRIQSTPNKMMRIDGATPVTHRQSLIDGFNADDSLYRVFLISSGTGSIGINLVSASRVILFDIGWNPLYDDQAVARAYRYGQRRRVYVYRLLTTGTWEDRLLSNNIFKVGLIRRVVDKQTMNRRVSKQDSQKYLQLPPARPPLITGDKVVKLASEYEDDSVFTGLLAAFSSQISRVTPQATLLANEDDPLHPDDLAALNAY
ncbi:hypothetical protein GGF37_005490, partial [Kickxella alabastrina]